ncbi:hypothetical protein EIP91_011108 [Steccherinum ochraceum]|uniref:Uncharacterized protein n=1 Tax=Steccherinum ochraceum TaxID=92696 RepID=A0A4V2MXT5_9APHY|nr:hypothetical protein EIP91_011108 [Steccherinum ochraceum]
MSHHPSPLWKTHPTIVVSSSRTDRIYQGGPESDRTLVVHPAVGNTPPQFLLERNTVYIGIQVFEHRKQAKALPSLIVVDDHWEAVRHSWPDPRCSDIPQSYTRRTIDNDVRLCASEIGLLNACFLKVPTCTVPGDGNCRSEAFRDMCRGFIAITAGADAPTGSELASFTGWDYLRRAFRMLGRQGLMRPDNDRAITAMKDYATQAFEAMLPIILSSSGTYQPLVAEVGARLGS